MTLDPFIIVWLVGVLWAMLYPRRRYLFSRLDRERELW